MLLVPYQQSGSGFGDQVPETYKPPSLTSRNSSGSSKQRKMLQMVLRLALQKAYDESSSFVSESGDRFDIIPLLQYALSPGRSVRGLEEFVVLLYRAGVEPEMLINPEVRDRLRQMIDSHSAPHDKDDNPPHPLPPPPPLSPDTPIPPNPFTFDEGEDGGGGGGGTANTYVSDNQIPDTWDTLDEEDEDGRKMLWDGDTRVATSNSIETQTPSPENKARGVQTIEPIVSSIATQTTPQQKSNSTNETSAQTDIPVSVDSETQTPREEILDETAVESEVNVPVANVPELHRTSREGRGRTKTGKVKKLARKVVKVKKPRVTKPTVETESALDPANDESASVRLTRSRKRRLKQAEDDRNQLGNQTKKNKNSLWDANDSDLDDGDTGEQTT